MGPKQRQDREDTFVEYFLHKNNKTGNSMLRGPGKIAQLQTEIIVYYYCFTFSGRGETTRQHA